MDTKTNAPASDAPAKSNFIRSIVEEDLKTGATDGRVVTRFPPEPNGYLHIGHAQAIWLNFGIANDYQGICHLRFDDTNPETEDPEFVAAIKRDVQWLGFDWDDKLFFASDYFERLYQMAVRLIKEGKAYVDSLTDEEIREYRGTVTEPGRPSPYRDRTVEENLDLFARMRAGEFPDGAHVLRAKIDMTSPNMLMRDPVFYRIKHAHHYRTQDAWPIYPLYDFAHPLSDAIENITHSICTLEFEVHRPLYDWLVENLFSAPRPHQYEFARLNPDYMITSKRKLRVLVEEGYVNGWDDPRMPTISGLRRRGVTPEAIRAFANMAGVSKVNSNTDISLLEYAIRDDLNYRAPRVMAVLDPLKVVLTNYPAGQTEKLDASYWPRDIPNEGTRSVPFSRVLYIERSDFREDPPKRFHRLSPGNEVRLRYGYIIRCESVVKDPETGEIIEVHCTYDSETKSGGANADRKVKGTIHWVSAEHALPIEARLYDRLFTVPDPTKVGEGETFLHHLNPDSLRVVHGFVEPSVVNDPLGTRYQFERQGYFIADSEDATSEHLVFNRIVSLRDTWAKIQNGKAASKKTTAKKTSSKTTQPRSASNKSSKPAAAPVLSPEQAARQARYVEELGLPKKQAYVLASDDAVSHYFEAILAVHDNPSSVANWVTNEVLRIAKNTPLTDLPFTVEALGHLIALVDEGDVASNIAKQVFAAMETEGGDPETIIAERGLKQVADTDLLEGIVRDVVAANPGKVVAYQSGKTGLIGFFMGQVMQATQGKANPQVVRELLQKALA